MDTLELGHVGFTAIRLKLQNKLNVISFFKRFYIRTLINYIIFNDSLTIIF